MDHKLQAVCDAFRIQGTYVGYEEIKTGNVNKTYKVNFLQPDGLPKSYVTQRVNTYAFKQPIKVMENIDWVTEHIRQKESGRVALHFHHTADRKTYVFDDDGGFWRLFNYIPSTTYNVTDNLQVVENAGIAFGEFQMQLHDFDAARLHETIPDFHNTRKRYESLLNTVDADPCGRVAQVRPQIDWLISVMDQACALTDRYERGELPLRVSHNDTKINNVLFEKDGDQALVVIDLDTVMPGLVGHDFGDAIRFAANFVEEDCPDSEKAGVNLEVFRAFSEGFLRYTSPTLTQNEVSTLALSCFALTAELAVRFLTDYIMGDPYFRIEYPEHNLVRTKCQIALAQDMLRKMDQMEKIIFDCVQKYI